MYHLTILRDLHLNYPGKIHSYLYITSRNYYGVKLLLMTSQSYINDGLGLFIVQCCRERLKSNNVNVSVKLSVENGASYIVVIVFYRG